MRIAIRTLLIVAAVIFFELLLNAEITVKVKDISFIDGLKENQIYGYGLVVGLQGSGDTKSEITKASLNNLLKSLGMEGQNTDSKNIAAVLLTAQLPPFVRIGDRIDVTVSSIGNAKSLEGGILMQSPLKGADNIIYAVAQGTLSVARGSRNRRGVKTVAVISDGALVEREIIPNVVSKNSIYIVLKNWDYSMASEIMKAISKKYPSANPEVINGKIKVNLIKNVDLPEFISAIQDIEIKPSFRARIVVNERDGTIVTGGTVKISEALVSKEGVTVEISGTYKKGTVSLLKESSTVKDLVDALNSIGTSTKDIISILKALKEAGALHAELIIK